MFGPLRSIWQQAVRSGCDVMVISEVLINRYIDTGRD